MDNFAPVLIPTLNRYEHFTRCIESLSACTHADHTDLFIALDYPLKKEHWDGYQKINHFITEISGFKSINVLRRSENFGAMKNYLESKKELFKAYDRLIFTEDDNVFSPNFLDYMSKGLKEFEGNQNVYAICGYNYPIEIPAKYSLNYYYVKTFSAWGYGIWRNRTRKEYYTPSELLTFMKKFKNVLNIYKMAPIKVQSILHSIKHNIPLYGDGVVSLQNIMFDTYCIFPSISKVQNWGHDGSGENCGHLINSVYLTQKIDMNIEFVYDDDVPMLDYKMIHEVKKYFRMKFVEKVRASIIYLIMITIPILKIKSKLE